MRVFAGIVPPAEALDELESALTTFRVTWPQLRWVPSRRFHLTLAFLGDIDETVAAAVSGRLADVAAARRAPMLSLSGAGTFPASGNPARILWTDLDGDRDDVVSLAGAVRTAARRAGAVDTDARPAHPHLTLARSRTPLDLRELRDQLAEFRGTDWQACEFHLFRSTLGPKPEYHPLATFPLAAVHRG